MLTFALMLVFTPCLTAAEPVQYPTQADGVLPTDTGFRGIWYFIKQRGGGPYKYKYSGGLGTYTQQLSPIAVYAPAVNKTFFVYGGRYPDRNVLLHEISYYDHATGKLARPRILLDKRTNDAHDNPVLSIDKEGYIWVFSNAHGRQRPAYIHRSKKPYDITAFEHVLTTNFSYAQPWYLDKFGFVFLHTRYNKHNHRQLYVSTSPDGRKWSEPTQLAATANGHYQTSNPFGDRVGTIFNYHPSRGNDWRTNLYYLQSSDGGKSWQNVTGQTVNLPLTKPDNPALIAEYDSKNLNVYLKDIGYTPNGRPVAMFLTSKGHASGPENDPRILKITAWNGHDWVEREVTRAADNNYDFASLYIESETHWRIIASIGPAPQAYHTGGEIIMYTSDDAGVTWAARPLTRHSKYNQNYPRRPLNAAPGFYAMWADGDGSKPSDSHLYFTTRDGDVYRMPDSIPDGVDMVDPEPYNIAPEIPRASDARPAGATRHLTVLISESEYETPTTLPKFIADELGPNITTTILQGSAKRYEDKTDSFPGVEAALKKSDGLIISVQRRALPPEQMAAIKAFIAGGKPVIGIRTASHAFSLRGKPAPEGFVSWESFDRDVLGGNYQLHYGHQHLPTITAIDGAADNPLLKGVTLPKVSGGSLYRNNPLPPGPKPLLKGTLEDGRTQPVAWTYMRSDGGRTFYTSLGHPKDFTQPGYLALLRNGIAWALRLPAAP